MTPAEALAALGVEPPPPGADPLRWWGTVRRAHRRLIRAAHPDHGGDTRTAARLNQALDVLSRATADGRHPPAPDTGGPRRPVGPRTTRPLHGIDTAGLTRRFARAASVVGSVTGVDPDSGIVTVVLDAPTRAELLIEIAPHGTGDTGDVPVVFTLEADGPGPALGPLVRRLLADPALAGGAAGPDPGATGP